LRRGMLTAYHAVMADRVGLNTDALKIVFRGTIQGTQSWSTALFMAIQTDSGNLTATNLNTIAGHLSTPSSTLWTSIAGVGWRSTTSFNEISVYYYPTGEPDPTEVSNLSVTAVVGGLTSATLSPRDALVASFLTGLSGRSYRGRSYAPMGGLPLGTDQQAPLVATTGLGNAWKVFIDAVNSANWNDGNVLAQVASVASFTRGITTPITTVRVDSLVDSQRRREDKFTSLHTYSVGI
jgi:hypothetical protein